MNTVRFSWEDDRVKIRIDMPGWLFMAIVTATIATLRIMDWLLSRYL